VSQEQLFDEKMRKLALRQLRLKAYYPHIILYVGLAIFGLLLMWSAGSAYIQSGQSDLSLFFLTHSNSLLNFIVGLVIFIVGGFLARRKLRALKNNADADVTKANSEASTWRR
jgi:cell division protein FtsW (lipid II flippase)